MTTGRSMIPVASPIIGDEEQEAVAAVIHSGMLAQGPQVAAFEDEFSAAVDGRRCVAVNSGTSALHLSLLALGIGRGDEVIVPSFTFAATANAVALAGAEPIFVDIDPTTYCMDPGAAAAAIGPRTAAIMPVHLYGHPADMTAFTALASSSGLALVEDAAQAHLATWRGTPVGAFGQAAAFSFYPTKNMTSGEGGMVVVADEQTARRVRLLRNQGMEERYRNEVVGFNNRMTDLHAAIGRVQFRKLCDWTIARQENAAYLSQHLSGVGVPGVAPGATHVFHQYTVRVPGERDAFAATLAEGGVGSGVYYPIPVHKLDSFDRDLELPNTTEACEQVLSLPVHPSLSQQDLQAIVAAVNAVSAVEAPGGAAPGGTA